MKKLAFMAAAAATLAGTPAWADIRLTTTPGSSTYNGGTTFDFDTKIPVNTCLTCIKSTSVKNMYSAPLGSTGNFFTVGPATQTSATIQLGRVGAYWLSFIWGSVDKYNSIDFLSATGEVLKSFTGSDVGTTSGNSSDPSSNPVATFHFSGTDAARVSSFRLNSSTNSFEIDNVRVVGVPEATTWGMLVLGFGMIGGLMRRRRTTVSFA